MRTRLALAGSLALLLSLSGTVPSAQAINALSVEGKVLGWIKIYDYKGATMPITQDGRVYSPAQLSIAQLFANWMQASYLPTGALGDVFQIRNAKLGLYNQNTAALPQSYGAMAKLYTQLKYGVNKKIEPLTTDAFLWMIQANGFYGIPAEAINTPEHYYFTLPTFAQQGYGSELEKAADVSADPVLGKLPTFFLRNSVSGNQKFVLLSKDGRLPFVTITRGEYLDAVGVAITRKRSAELKRITEARQGNQKDIDFEMKDVDARTAKRIAVLAQNREKYKTRLQETAEISTDEPDIMFENYDDVFVRNGGTAMRLAVYKVDPRLAELCKTDAPQWITITWTAHLNDPVSKSLHEAMLHNVNVQYIHDYFFAPEKVKGQPYTPLRSPSAVETPAVVDSSTTAKKSAADPSVHFFDDFSSTPVGKTPLNWRSTLDNTGASSIASELKGLDGHWASINGFKLTPTTLKAPLPTDFEVSYEVVAAQNYTWGAKGLTMKLSKPAAAGVAESFLSVRTRPGFDGREGETVIEAEFPGAPGYLSGTKWVTAPGFSNNALNNHIKVTIRKKGELLQVLIGGTTLAEYAKGIPAALQFSALSFDLSAGSANDKMFIGNVKIAIY